MVRPPEIALPPLEDAARSDLRETAGGMLRSLRAHGGSPDGSVTRLVYSPEWQSAMGEVETWFADWGLVTEVDAVGSRVGKLHGDDPSIVLTGSHIDSVSGGGAYDGALGVVMAICAVGWLAKSLGRPRRSLAVLANCEEESSRFAGNFWGARAMLGLIAPHELDSLRDADGITIAEAMRSCGLDPARIQDARRTDLAAFVECHIEQGPRLEAAGARLGIVEWVVGVRQREFRFAGMSGHAGTIPMEQRRDALVAAAEFVTSTYRMALEARNGAVATVGTMVVHPGGSNQIPGDALLTVDFRHSDESALDELERRLIDGARETANRNGVELSTSERLNQRPVGFDPDLRHIIERSCEEVGASHMRLASGAGHDAQLLARHMPAAMLFVPSKGGRSHRPDEDTDIEDIVAGIEVLIRTLYRLAYVSP